MFGDEDELSNWDEMLALLNPWPSTSHPIALLPFHIETKFIHRDGHPELLIRIYPDDLQIDTHEPELTDEEVDWGKHYWEQVGAAGGREDLERSAWAQLANHFGVERAVWIAHAFDPENHTGELAPAPPGGKSESWTRPPRSEVLPDQWIVLAYRCNRRVMFQAGGKNEGTLAVGPDPGSQLPADVADDELAIDEGMRWLVDFSEAERKGMGIRIWISEDDAREGYEFLCVLGVKTTVDANDSASLLEKLFEAKHYTDGLGFVPQGTPTNNTPEVASGYTSGDPGYERSFVAERKHHELGENSNGKVTARALGIDSKVFEHLLYADLEEQADARAMNIALWPATWG